MNFEVDVSGEELLSKNYSICLANKDSLIKGFKFENNLVNILCSKYGQNIYKYKKSRKEKALFKIRLYCIAIYYLIKSLNFNGEISLNLCRDFQGKENDIRENLKFLINKIKGVLLEDRIYFVKLDKTSNAHKYASLMREDIKNKMNILN